MKVSLLDTHTGQTCEVAGIRGFEWAENNWSCDCNRESYFDVDETGSGTCIGCHRFLVIAAEPEDQDDEGYTLADLNSSYPDELRAQHGVP